MMRRLYTDYRGGFAPGLPIAEFLAARRWGRRIVMAGEQVEETMHLASGGVATVRGPAACGPPCKVLYHDNERLAVFAIRLVQVAR